MQPLIGVSVFSQPGPEDSKLYSVNQRYLQAIGNAGGIPLMIPLGLENSQLDRILERLDGLLLTGGGDIDPARFGQEADGHAKEIDAERDRTELYLLQQVLQRQVPFMGICRGFQIVNVGMGGTLFTDISAQRPGSERHDYYPDIPRDHLAHSVRLEANSRLASILGGVNVQVNSLHHQGVDRLAGGLTAAGTAPDGLVEAVEVAQHPYGLAVQWHPEWLQAYAPMRQLFRALIEASQRSR